MEAEIAEAVTMPWADCVVCSPPYAETGLSLPADAKVIVNPPPPGAVRKYRRKPPCQDYGHTEGQLGGIHAGTSPPTEGDMHTVPIVEWQDCYAGSWKGLITPASFAHPAKMSRSLLCRILDFMLEQGWLERGDVLLDPFGGIGTTGIEAASRGIRAVCVELEPRFVGLARQSFDLHRRTWEQFGDPLPQIVQGDSRRLSAVLREARAVVSSPPFIDERAFYGRGEQGGGSATEQRKGRSAVSFNEYGATPGQLGALPPGSVEGVVSSPPWENQVPNHTEGAEWHQKRNSIGQNNSLGRSVAMGTTEGQLGALPPGSVEGVVSSPPYAEALSDQRESRGPGQTSCNDPRKAGKRYTADGASSAAGYGTTPGQLGALPPGSVEGVVSSPPYAGSISSQDKEWIATKLLRGDKRKAGYALSPSDAADYGHTSGQLGALPPGSPPAADSVVASPPSADSVASAGHDAVSMRLGSGGNDYDQKRPYEKRGFLGDPPANLGSFRNTTPTFWEAAAQVLRETHAVLRPGVYTAWVCKPFVRAKKLVDFPGDWARLLSATGFEVVLEVHASLVKTDRHPGLFGESVKRKEKKSFFRRLAEKKGSPEVNFEVVLFARRMP